MAWRAQNSSHPHYTRVPGYYARNKLYPDAYSRVESQTRTSRRIHDGFTINTNYGLDTTSDDVNSSPYSSPYYINGRYNSDNLTTQRGNSASVQGTKKIYLPEELIERDDVELTQEPEATIEMWQGKQIKFWMPFKKKIVGNQIILKNTGECTGILSIYFSTTPDGEPIYETAIDLCDVSPDAFEKFELYSMTTVPANANGKKRVYVRMEIWDEIDQKRSENPFNTGRKIEIAATGLGNHEESIIRLGDKNTPVKEKYEYSPMPSRPNLGLVYSDWRSIPVDRIDNMKTGARVFRFQEKYDIFCVNNGAQAFLMAYDLVNKKIVTTQNRIGEDTWKLMEVNSKAKQINIAQFSLQGGGAAGRSFVAVVDGESPLRYMQIGVWNDQRTFPSTSGDDVSVTIDEDKWFNSDLGKASGYYVFEYKMDTSTMTRGWFNSGKVVDLQGTYGIKVTGTPAEGSVINVSSTVSLSGQKVMQSYEYADARPVVGASLIMFHNNRLYLAGFKYDPNLVQCSSIEDDGPDFFSFPYRFYVPNRSPYDTTSTPLVAMVEYATDQIMFVGKAFYSIFKTYSSSSAPSMESGMPTQVSTWVDSGGIQWQGDICNYKGVIYSYDQKEGLRRFSGATWSRLPTTVDSHYDRVDMDRPRKLWGYANKLYFNYYDVKDGKAKCLVWDMQMNYQQFPWFQDVDIPFCDARWNETEEIVGIHPDYPMIMALYAEDTWRRLDTPIQFRRDTKFLNMPGNSADFTVNRLHVKVLNNSNRWWWISITGDKQNMTQFRGHDTYWRQPVWDTITVTEPIETPFPFEDAFEENAIYRMDIMDVRVRATAIQARVKTKTFRKQADLVSVEFEVAPKDYI